MRSLLAGRWSAFMITCAWGGQASTRRGKEHIYQEHLGKKIGRAEARVKYPICGCFRAKLPKQGVVRRSTDKWAGKFALTTVGSGQLVRQATRHQLHSTRRREQCVEGDMRRGRTAWKRRSLGTIHCKVSFFCACFGCNANGVNANSVDELEVRGRVGSSTARARERNQSCTLLVSSNEPQRCKLVRASTAS